MMQVFAASGDWGSCVGSGAAEGVATIGCLEPLFANIVQGVLALSGVALFVMLLIGGFSFLFSGGDPKKLEAARGTIANAIMGLVIILAAYLILNIIHVFTGVDVTKFQVIPQQGVMRSSSQIGH